MASDLDVLHAEYRFMRTAAHDGDLSQEEKRMARTYYLKLARDMCLVDLSQAERTGFVGMRWRTQGEVLEGKGRLICGALDCSYTAACAEGLISASTPFSYIEDGISHTVETRTVLCLSCHELLARSRSRAAASLAKRRRRRRRRARRSASSSSSYSAHDEHDPSHASAHTRKKAKAQ